MVSLTGILTIIILVIRQAEKSKDVAASETKDTDKTADRSEQDSGDQPDLFEENFKELKKWVDVKSKYGTLLVIRERRSGRLGTALKVFFSLPDLCLPIHNHT